MSVNPLRSVGARLSLALVGTVAIALALVYLVVVPSLRHNLVGSKVAQLRRGAAVLAKKMPASPYDMPDFVLNAAGTSDARVVVLSPLGQNAMAPLEDSNLGASSTDVENDPIVLRASSTLQPASGTVERNDVQYAEAAHPVGTAGDVILLSAPVRDSLRTVHVVQRRLVLAGAVALLVALGLGYGGALVFTRRIRRLERAADRIAAGDFEEPVRDDSEDELGQLAASFERMRLRLAQLDHARREFIANASHELRTPLFSLGGFIELLTDEELDEPTRQEFLATMGEQVERLARLATDLLDLSRLDAGRVHPERRPLDLHELAEELGSEFRPLAQARGHDLRVDLADAQAEADEERVLRIGRVLVENALRHTPTGTCVRICTGERDGDAILSVEDDGPGIAPEHAEQVFDRFYRVDGGRASGSGLGLAIARELAELMHGRIELESRPGRNVFRLVLPRSATPAAFSRENVPEPVA